VETVPRSAAAAELGVLDDVPGATGDPTLDDLLEQPPGSVPAAARRARGA
jgi:DNA recombination protein RmuC